MFAADKITKFLNANTLQVGDSGVSSLVFGIGGPYGHSNEVRSRANETIKLSDMVLNHQVRCMLLLHKKRQQALILLY